MEAFNHPKIIELLSQGDKTLQESGIENSRREAMVLLAHVLGIDDKKLLTRLKDQVEDPRVCTDFNDLLIKRCAQNPLQYLTGTQEFMSLEFAVTPDVLVPRWDTEILVEAALEKLKNYQNPLVVDIGTGSGAIIISLAKYYPRGNYYAVDISDAALAVAKQNAKRHNVDDKITFIKGDLLSPFLTNCQLSTVNGQLPTDNCQLSIVNSQFDVVVSNPPYIPTREINHLPRDVQKEPHLALDGGADGLDIYQKLIPQIHQVLKPGGEVFLEIGYNQGNDVSNLCAQEGFTNRKILQDFAQLDRVVYACKKKTP